MFIIYTKTVYNEKHHERLPFWNHLTKNQQEYVLSRLTVLQYEAGQIIHGLFNDCLGLILMIEGSLNASLLSPDGREITLYRIKEKEFCVLSTSCVLESISFETQVKAENNCKILLLPIDVFSSLMNNNIYVQRDVYKLATERFSQVVGGIERLVFMSIEQRLVSFLLEESATKNSNFVHMTHEQIAVNIGSAREVVSRSLRTMSQKGWLELSRGTIKILEKEMLCKLL